MGLPNLEPTDIILGIASELTSAISALNMEPDPVNNATGTFLSETDQWVAHSIEHIQAALHLLNKIPRDNVYVWKPVSTKN